MKQTFLSLIVLALAAAPLTVHAAACRDAKGRFVACGKTVAAKPVAHTASMHPAARATPAPHVTATMHTAAKAAPKRCKIGNRFASCSAPGAKPV